MADGRGVCAQQAQQRTADGRPKSETFPPVTMGADVRADSSPHVNKRWVWGGEQQKRLALKSVCGNLCITGAGRIRATGRPLIVCLQQHRPFRQQFLHTNILRIRFCFPANPPNVNSPLLVASAFAVRCDNGTHSFSSGTEFVTARAPCLRRSVELCRHSRGKGEGAMRTLLASCLVSGAIVHWMTFLTIFVAYLTRI